MSDKSGIFKFISESAN